MNPAQNETGGVKSQNPVIHYAIQLLALALLLVWCFKILEPFMTPLVWGSVLAVALYPLHKMLSKRLKGRNAWSATIITVLFLLLIIGPAIWLLLATVDEFKDLGTAYRQGELSIPPPTEKVKDWPLIGAPLYGYWTEASKNLSDLIAKHRDEVKTVILQLFDLLRGTSKGILLFTLSIIISGVLLAYAKAAGDFARSLFVRLVGPAGVNLTESAELTIRNVAKGVLGVAVIQSILAGIGFVVAGVPFAGLWILVCLILAIVQIGILPVSIGVIIYIWSAADTLTATILTIWMIIVGISDNILKPILLGKGAPAPMLVVFLGAIGGFIFSGFIGLFTGAIVLTLGYKMVSAWLNQVEIPQQGKLD
ncbi:MAG TPA: AI-2E family transporter [Cyclobacteriaceae bacterium]|nr:AI-2E family transporter [Cyclobacteriaceae bacterium]